MQKWDYCLVRFDVSPKQNALVPHVINDQEIQNWEDQNTTIPSFVINLGNQGWELVTFFPIVNALIFKRPKR